MQCDVLVVGGGSAGLAAAVSAARQGAKTLLLERHGSLGGMATASLIHSICGLYRFADGPMAEYANSGFGRRFAERLIASGGAGGPARLGKVDVLFHQPAAFAGVADEFALEAPNLEVRFHSEVIAASHDLRGIEISCRGKRESVEALAVVDASGDAVVADLSGEACEKESAGHLQRPAFVFAFGNVPADAVNEDGRLKLANIVAQAVQGKKLPVAALATTFRSTGRQVFATINLDDEVYDPLDPACLTRLEMAGRMTARVLADYLREHVEGFARSYIAALPARVGVRESRRVVGRMRLERDDYMAGTAFDDQVAVISWPMELREKANQIRLVFPATGKACGIPLRALRARDREALFVAGRCISSSHDVQASIRVIGTCFATGEAAGIAAALFANGEKNPTAPQVLAARL